MVSIVPGGKGQAEGKVTVKMNSATSPHQSLNGVTPHVVYRNTRELPKTISRFHRILQNVLQGYLEKGVPFFIP